MYFMYMYVFTYIIFCHNVTILLDIFTLQFIKLTIRILVIQLLVFCNKIVYVICCKQHTCLQKKRQQKGEISGKI